VTSGAEPALTELTGERTLPGVPGENYWFRRHEAAYAYLSGRLGGRRLLDVGTGEGYGAARLAGRFDTVVALDYDWAAVAGLGRRYPQLQAVQANLAALPLASSSLDAVTALQVVEHVWWCEQFLLECRRVLRTGGQLVLSTPNRLTFSPGLNRGQKPANPFHVREFDAEELVELVRAAGFGSIRLLGLHPATRLHHLDTRHEGGLVAAQLAREPASWPDRLQRDVASVTRADFTVRAEGIEHCLDLMVLAGQAPGGQG